MKSAIILSAVMYFTATAFSQIIDEKTALEEKAVLAAEHNWLDANKKSDVNALQTLLREDYIDLDFNGRIKNKVDVLKATDELASDPKKGGGPVLSLNAVRVRLYGDVAVLTGGGGLGGPKGSPIRFTHIWVRTRDVWQLSTSQTTRIAPLPNTPHAPVKIEKAH